MHTYEDTRARTLTCTLIHTQYTIHKHINSLKCTLLIIHLRTFTLIHTYKIANMVISYLYNYMFFNNFVIMFQSAKNGLKPVPRQQSK